MFMFYYISNYSYTFLSNYSIKSQKRKCAVVAAYLEKARLETKLWKEQWSSEAKLNSLWGIKPNILALTRYKTGNKEPQRCAIDTRCLDFTVDASAV